MLKRLKEHWNVNTTELTLILCTFAITGTATAWFSKNISEWLLLEKHGIAWWSSKILVFIFGYQVIILIVGFCLGMFSFFWKYEKKILSRLGLMKNHKNIDTVSPKGNPATSVSHTEIKRIAIFASGAGSNAQKIINHFKNNKNIQVALIVCNNPKAGVLKIAESENIPVLLIEKNKFLETGFVKKMNNHKISWIILAGFLWKIPTILIREFPGRIINIHPALLPSYGGKGMYGNAVHQAVIDAKEKESGISIHFVDEIYDHGKIIFQTTCTISEDETPLTLANKIHALEHEFYPQIIEDIINSIQ